jgi:hypothetical protein
MKYLKISKNLKLRDYSIQFKYKTRKYIEIIVINNEKISTFKRI